MIVLVNYFFFVNLRFLHAVKCIHTCTSLEGKYINYIELELSMFLGYLQDSKRKVNIYLHLEQNSKPELLQ